MTRSILTALAVLFALPAAAAQECGPKDTMYERIRARLNQSRQSEMLDAGQQIITLWADPAGKWTLTVTTPNGLACVVGNGTDHTPLADEAAGEVM